MSRKMKRASRKALILRVRTILWLEGGYVPKHHREWVALCEHACRCRLVSSKLGIGWDNPPRRIRGGWFVGAG